MKFIINSPGYNPSIGGIMALHKLCHLMNEMGLDCKLWLWDGETNPEWNTPVADEYNGEVVIYPEIVHGNPLEAEKVVRWCLNAPGKLGGPGEYPDTDIVFYYWDFFAPKGSENILTVLEVQDCWRDLGMKRSGYCYAIRKGGDMEHKPGAVNIGATHEYSRLVALFNSKEYFYTNDDRTFLSQQAAMCGCISVVDSEGDRTAWRRRMPINQLGIAFGWGDDEIEHAKITKHLVRDTIEHIQAETEKQIEHLISQCG